MSQSRCLSDLLDSILYYYNNDEDAKLFDTYSCMLVNTTFVHSLNGFYGNIRKLPGCGAMLANLEMEIQAA